MKLRGELGYADYIGMLQAFHDGLDDDPDFLLMSAFLLEYPVRAAPVSALTRSHRVPSHARSACSAVRRLHDISNAKTSALRQMGRGRGVRADQHKQNALAAVQQRYPAVHYVMIDDKPQLLGAMKKVIGMRLTTVFVHRGYYAREFAGAGINPLTDICIERIGELIDFNMSHFLAAVPMHAAVPEMDYISHEHI